MTWQDEERADLAEAAVEVNTPLSLARVVAVMLVAAQDGGLPFGVEVYCEGADGRLKPVSSVYARDGKIVLVHP